MRTEPSDPQEQQAPRLGWKTVAVTMAFYLVCLAIATWPRVLSLGSCLPERFDSLQHLWIMRWYKTCLLEGRSVFLCPEIQHPIGAPLGNFSALHLQALLYLPLSLAIANDALCYNLIWLLGLLTTGLGTFVLIWYLLRDRACAAFGGLLAMLNTPLLLHAHAHLELIYVGGFPLFLVAWMRFVDRPSRARMVLAAIGYVVLAMSAAYFLVFAIFPAVLYVVWQALRGGWRSAWPWVRDRAGWLLGFGGLVLPGLVLLFSSQFWAIGHGHVLARPRHEFDAFGAPIWSYLAPTCVHALHAVFGSNPYEALGPSWGERASYLGVVTLALMVYAALNRVAFRNAGYLWSAFVLVVVLSLGAHEYVGRWRISLPSDWLWKFFPIYRLTRVPARFNLFAGVLAGVLAAAGLRHLLARLPRPAWRLVLLGGLTAAAVADLAMIPFWMETIPEMPACYAFIKQRDPKATIVELPIAGTGGSTLNASCTYWQSLHRLTTSAGYSGHANALEDARTGHNSPFHEGRLGDPRYLADPAHVNVDVTHDVDFKDFVWLYLTVNRFDYIVLHEWAAALPSPPVLLDQLKTLLAECKVYDDGATIVYARSLLRPPSRPVHICLEEWQERSLWQGRFNCRIPSSARIVVYNPDPGRDLTLSLMTGSPVQEQVVQVRAGTQRLARWDVAAGGYQDCVSHPFRLPAGIQELTIECDIRPDMPANQNGPSGRARKPRRIRIASITLGQEPAPAGSMARKPAEETGSNKTTR